MTALLLDIFGDRILQPAVALGQATATGHQQRHRLPNVGHQLLLSNQVDPEAIHTTRALLPALRQLPMHRTDLVASNGPVAWQQLQEMGVDLSRYEEVWTLGNEEFCYSFNRQIDDARVQQFQQALDRVRQQADYPALLQRFGLAP